MKKTTTSELALASHSELTSAVETAWDAVGQSFDQFCLIAGVAALSEIMEDDVKGLAGDAHARNTDKPGYRWGRTRGRLGFHGGKVELERPRVRSKSTGKELPLPSWQEAAAAGWLEEWAMNLMLMNVATRKVGRAVRLPEAGISADAGSGLSKSAVSRRFKALTEARLAEWMASDLSQLDLLVIQIDGLHMADNLLMIGAVGVDAEGRKHPLGVVEGATENSATVQTLLDNLIERGVDPEVCRLFIVDGAKALTKAIRRTFGADIPIQRCQVHKARNITDRLDPKRHAAVRRALRQAWEMDDADKAERLLRSLARRLELEAPGVSKSILEGLDEILTVIRLGLPIELRRSLASTNIIESMNAVIRQVCRNVKRWRDAQMALRWTAAGMLEAAKGFRRLKAYRQLPILKAALKKHRDPEAGAPIDPIAEAA
ncbi:IS256 family transposase [Halocynthiibacter sp. C4]|uniref:IS256 family transposase n=1 Tax=Halocynthiibacter sp. C4 TaxID=2992758 RepID=UPI00237B0E90|nr:IS256 family transposase [Halocynthiibacter sp. C4]MDE0591173.1 IS256 family transposase [Halocynthiibacter sp. C4]